MSLAPGDTLAHYRIAYKLGAGGMGEVWKAEDTRLGRSVALKILPAGSGSRSGSLNRLRDEARVIAALNHPNIVTLFAIEEADGVQFLTMELIEGDTLTAEIPGDGLPLDRIIQIARPLAAAVGAAHQQGIVHRDLKSSNVMLTRDGEVKVLDFGLAKLLRSDTGTDLDNENSRTVTVAGQLIGTPAYMSPEHLGGGEIDPRSDVFSLGILLHEISTGHRPFTGTSFPELISAIMRDRPALVSDLKSSLPVGLARIIERCLHKQPSRRYPSAGALLAALDEFAEKPERTPRGTGESIAVLPFADLSPEGNQLYFCDGMMDELIHALSRVEGLRVVSRTSALQFRGHSGNVGAIGERLNVNAVLEGSVRKAGNRLRVTVQLVNTDDGYQLWADRYDRELDDVFAVQDEIARTVVGALRREMMPAADQTLVRQRTDDLEAYNLYLEGRHFWNQRTEVALARSVDRFLAAVGRDPNYAPAYAGLADAYTLLAVYGAAPPAEVLPRARVAAEHALAIDPELAGAHSALACFRCLHDREWADAELSFRRAIELDPGYSFAHQRYANDLLIPHRRFDDARRVIETALELDGLSLAVNASAGLVSFFARRYDEAIEAHRRTLELDSGFAVGHLFLGQAYCETERFPEALDEIETAIGLSGGSPEMTAALGYVHARAGHADRAQAVLDELAALGDRRYVSHVLPAQVEAGLDRVGPALDRLAQANETRAADLVWLTVRPAFDRLRGDARFCALALELALPTG